MTKYLVNKRREQCVLSLLQLKLDHTSAPGALKTREISTGIGRADYLLWLWLWLRFIFAQ